MMNELRSQKYKKLIQTTSYLPHFISLVVVCGMVIDFTSGRGFITHYVNLLTGKDYKNLLEVKEFYRAIYIASDIWQTAGWGSIIYLAALSGVDMSLYEAAKIDGATKGQTLFRVTIPMVMPSITICMFLTLSNSFKLFDQNLALTAGLPYIIQPDGSAIKTTEMLALNIYQTFYSQGTTSPGVAQAKAVVFFVLVAGLGLMQLAITRKKEVQQ